MGDFLTGTLLKVYDDFVDDEPYITNEYSITILRYLQVACVTIVILQDFWIGIMFAAFNGICALASFGEYSNPHVFSYFFLVPFLLLFSKVPSGKFTGLDFVIIILTLEFAIVEPKLYPEESSFEKMIMRTLCAVGAMNGALAYPVHSSVASFLKMLAGYSVTSSIDQMLKMYLLPSLYAGHNVKGIELLEEQIHRIRDLKFIW